MPKFNLEAVITADDRASGKIKKSSESFKKFAKTIAAVGVAAAGAAIAIGVKAVKAAASFEAKMADVSTLVDINVESMDEMSDAVLRLSTTLPVSADELATALYQVRSAGVSAADAMDVLEASAKLAIAGLGTTEEAVDLVTSSLNSFAAENLTADKAADILFKTVKAGKTTVGELAQAFGMVAPMAASMKVRFDELQAATAALTVTGMKTSVAQTQIRASLTSLIKPTKEMGELFDILEVETAQLGIAQWGLVGFFGKLTEAADGNQEMLAKAFGSVEALNAVLALTGPQGEAFKETLEGMRDGTSLLDEAVQKQTDTFDAQYKMLTNYLNVALIKLGNEILPVINTFVKESLTPTIQFLTGDFDALAKNTKKSNDKFEKLLVVWYTVIGTGRIIKNIIKGIASVLAWLIYPLVRGIDQMMNFGHIWRREWNRAKNIAILSIRAIINWIDNVINKAREMVSAIRTAPSRALSRVGGWLGFQGGGIIPETGMYQLHKGERVTPSEFVTNKDQSVVVNFYGNINNTANASLDDIGARIGRSIALARQGAI